ncbi:MAG: hypothetical protein KAV87_54235 [Desulfobacteraceae bacterium]|nr:hypothetical protein [Desulfobacteraceae bacterium]
MIEINGIKQRDEKRQIAFFTIDGQEFACGNVPTELTKIEDVQAHLDARADEFKLLILKKHYRESDHKRFQADDKTELEAMQAWVAAGHKNKIQIGLTIAGNPKYGYEVIEKQELEYRHPKSVSIMAKIEGANITPELKDLLKEIVK